MHRLTGYVCKISISYYLAIEGIYLGIHYQRIKIKPLIYAGLVALILLMPHILWLIHTDFIPLHYMMARGNHPALFSDHFMNP